jgi:ferredoxin
MFRPKPLASGGQNINRKGEPPADADEWRDKTGKAEYFSPNPGQGS